MDDLSATGAAETAMTSSGSLISMLLLPYGRPMLDRKLRFMADPAQIELAHP